MTVEFLHLQLFYAACVRNCLQRGWLEFRAAGYRGPLYHSHRHGGDVGWRHGLGFGGLAVWVCVNMGDWQY